MKSFRLVLARAATQRMRRAQPPIGTVLTEALGCRNGSRFISLALFQYRSAAGFQIGIPGRLHRFGRD
jgi:hypothetical protein